MPWTNFHSHSLFCDGADDPEKYILAAINEKIIAYGFSSHAPVNFKTDWCIPDNRLSEYIEKVKYIKKKYHSEIQTYLGLEIDYIPGVSGRNKHLNYMLDLDYFIGSVHFCGYFPDGTPWNIDHTPELFLKGLKEIYKNNFRKATEVFYENTRLMVTEDKPDVIGHLDKIKMFNNQGFCFDENEKYYREQVALTLQTIKNTGSIVEINTRGYYRYGQLDLYPSQWALEMIAKMDIPVMLNSDCHKADEITAGFIYAVEILKKAGIQKLWSLLDEKWQGFDFDRTGILPN
ncbi:MAG: histidinol-phosphatase [Bacteroidales bacterium]|nr:histidinol-phosphatase [Bacteroidales bacterium]